MANVGLKPIYRVEQTYNNKTYEGAFSADAENVLISWPANPNWKYNLQEFFENWLDFKAYSNFMYYGNPQDPDELPAQIKFWYKTTTQ